MNSNNLFWSISLALFSTLVTPPASLASDIEDDYPSKWGETMVFEQQFSETQRLPAYQTEIIELEPTPKLTAAEYAEQQARDRERRYPETVNPKIRQLIYLLQVRKFIKTFIPLPLPF